MHHDVHNTHDHSFSLETIKFRLHFGVRHRDVMFMHLEHGLTKLDDGLAGLGGLEHLEKISIGIRLNPESYCRRTKRITDSKRGILYPNSEELERE